MTNPMVRIHDVETGEIVDREMTNEEFANHKTMVETSLLLTLQRQAKETEKAALLERLGITAEEAKLLLS